LKGIIAKLKDLARREIFGGQRQAITGMLTVAGPFFRERNSLAYGTFIKRRAWIRHRRVEIGELAVEIKSQIECGLHGLVIILRQAEDEIAEHVAAATPTPTRDVGPFLLPKSFTDTARNTPPPRLNAERQPIEPRRFQLFQHSLLDCVHARISPDVEIVVTLD